MKANDFDDDDNEHNLINTNKKINESESEISDISNNTKIRLMINSQKPIEY